MAQINPPSPSCKKVCIAIRVRPSNGGVILPEFERMNNTSGLMDVTMTWSEAFLHHFEVTVDPARYSVRRPGFKKYGLLEKIEVMTADSKHERNEYVVHVEDETAENPPLVRKAKGINPAKLKRETSASTFKNRLLGQNAVLKIKLEGLFEVSKAVGVKKPKRARLDQGPGPSVKKGTKTNVKVKSKVDERLVPKEKIGEEKKDDDEESQQSDLMQDQSESMDLRLNEIKIQDKNCADKM
ncbi:uncharacterized protein LOC110841908 [Folsomia candida]|uniref:Uncharacterized protein n=1 Tax=Folsomia candida TaxID=158441 RepID=A0A226F5E6_FOLCA|nr:uncharacterized protein LOC110841908 [Folsomia candida]OXA64570.1 hypothetical protein Fcan01_01471 [Folsomia candida]